jgi:serine/threonine protein kinase
MLSSWNDEEAELKLVDFGCSLIVDEDAINDKSYPSTPAYEPPEKIINKSAPNFKSDVWAAGCILYIILTGTHVSNLIRLSLSVQQCINSQPLASIIFLAFRQVQYRH